MGEVVLISPVRGVIFQEKNVSFAFASETQSEYGRIYTYSVGRFISNHLPS